MATLISVLALAVSVVSAIYSFRLQRFDSLRSTRDQLHTTVNELIKLSAEYQILWSVPEKDRDTSFYQRSGSIMQTAVAISRQAVYLVEQHPELVTDIEYYTIAQALVLAADYEQADKFWQNAIEASPNNYYKVINIRAYADFLFNQGQAEAGRELYKQALRLLDSSKDFHRHSNGLTEQYWMVSESYHGFWSEATSHFEAAKEWFGLVTNQSSKETGLNGLKQAFDYYDAMQKGNRPDANLAPAAFGVGGTAPDQNAAGRPAAIIPRD